MEQSEVLFAIHVNTYIFDGFIYNLEKKQKIPEIKRKEKREKRKIMNIKKYSIKTMWVALACTTILSSTLAAYAAAPINDSAGASLSDSGWITEENNIENIKVAYQQTSSYTVTIPKAIVLNTKKQAVYSVKISGDIDANQRVYVAPVDGITDSENLDFYMSDLSGKKADVVATVTQSKTYWNSEDVANAYEETQNCVSALDLTAGTWVGTFQVEIRLETEKKQEHTHNYVDGKCECGAIDPNHIHNYEDGTCTICGEKETDSYEMASAEAYSNWNYTLDDENSIITLNYYTGSETDVIVYANYIVDGENYMTQLASNTNSADEDTPYMFNGMAETNCQNIKTIAFSERIDTSNVTNMKDMFCACSSLTTLNVSGFYISNVTDMQGMFGNCSNLGSLDLNSFDTSNVTNMRGMFNGCTSLTNLDISHFDTSNVTDMSSMFYGCSSLTDLDVSHFDTSNVTDMSGMFYGCSSLMDLDVNIFDTIKVTNMSSMFYGCSSLTDLDVSHFDTSNVTDMGGMFNNCASLTIFDFRNFDTSNVTDMGGMFNSCVSLTILDLRDFDTSNIKNMNEMFKNCSQLTDVDLRNFDTSSVTSMDAMFENCSSLTNLDLCSFDTSNAACMRHMFMDCPNLKTIYVTRGKWSTENASTTDMFQSCGTSSVIYI